MADILLSKMCNAFLPTAQAKDVRDIHDRYAISALVGGFASNQAAKAANSAIKRYQKKHGGLWVGGRFVVTESELTFSQNALNKRIHLSKNDFSILLSSIESVERVFGFITGIIVITTTNNLQYKIRCFNAKAAVAKINEILNH